MGGPSKSPGSPILQKATPQASRDELPPNMKLALQELNEEDVWSGTPAFFRALAPFRTELRKMSKKSSPEDSVIKFHIPPQLSAASTSGKKGKLKLQETSKSYKVLPSTPIREILSKLFQNTTDVVMTSLSGYILDDKECLGSFGFGSLLPTWELRVAIKESIKPLFGTALGALFESRAKDQYQNRDFLVKVIEEIKTRNAETIIDPMLGQFSREEVLQMKKQIDIFGKLEIKTAPVNDLLALLMLYLGLLPGPLFPKSVRSLVSGGGIGCWEKMNDEELLNLASKVRHAFEGGSGFEKECSRYILDFLYLILNKSDIDARTLAKGFTSRGFFSLAERQLLKAGQSGRLVRGNFAPTTSCISPEEMSAASPAVNLPRLNLSNSSGKSEPPKKEKKKRRLLTSEKPQPHQDVAPPPIEVQSLEGLLEFLLVYYPDVFLPELSKPLRFLGSEATTRGYVLFGTLEEERRLLEFAVREREGDVDGVLVELEEWKGKAEELLDDVKSRELSLLSLEELVQQLEAKEVELESKLRDEAKKRKKEEENVEKHRKTIEKLQQKLKETEEKLEETENNHKCIKYTTDATIAQLQSFLQISEKAHSETSEKLNSTTANLERSRSRVEALELSTQNQEKQIGSLNVKLSTVEDKLTEKDKALVENAEVDQEMRKLMSELHDQLSNLRSENSNLKREKEECSKKLEEEKEQCQKTLEDFKEKSAQLQVEWASKEKGILNELEVTKREHERELEFQANEKMELKRKTKSLEEKNKNLKSNSRESEKKMNEAVLQLESHLSTVGSERKKTAEAERKNWLLQKGHAEEIRKLKKEVHQLKSTEESLKAQLATLSSPPPQTARLTSRELSRSGLTAREGRMTYRATKDRIASPKIPSSQRPLSSRPPMGEGGAFNASALQAQKTKLTQAAQKEEEKKEEKKEGNDLLESLAARFQTIRQLETEDLKCSDDDFESGFSDDSDDEMFF